MSLIPIFSPSSLDPALLADIYGHWRSDSMVSSGGKLTSFTDRSANGYTLSPQGTNPDIVATGPTGVDAVDLDTVADGNERLEASHAGLNLPSCHFFAAMRIDTYTAANRMMIYGSNTSTTGDVSGIYAAVANDRPSVKTNDGATKTADASVAVAAGDWFFLDAYVKDGVEIGISIDGGAYATTAIGSVAAAQQFDNLCLGANGSGLDQNDISLADLLIFQAAKEGASDRGPIQSYFQKLYGSFGTW